jgi:hypothetical protein
VWLPTIAESQHWRASTRKPEPRILLSDDPLLYPSKK